MPNRCEKTSGELETKSVAMMLEKLIEKNRAHARALEELARRVEAAEADARQREAGLAARLDETRSELAEAVAAGESEKERRIEAEQAVTAARAAIEQARRVLDALSTAPAAVAPAMEAPLAIDHSETELPGPPADINAPAEADLGVELPSVNELSDEIKGEQSMDDAIVTLTLSPAECAALAARAAREGFQDGAAYATHLVREALCEVERPAALAGLTAGSG